MLTRANWASLVCCCCCCCCFTYSCSVDLGPAAAGLAGWMAGSQGANWMAFRRFPHSPQALYHPTGGFIGMYGDVDWFMILSSISYSCNVNDQLSPFIRHSRFRWKRCWLWKVPYRVASSLHTVRGRCRCRTLQQPFAMRRCLRLGGDASRWRVAPNRKQRLPSNTERVQRWHRTFLKESE